MNNENTRTFLEINLEMAAENIRNMTLEEGERRERRLVAYTLQSSADLEILENAQQADQNRYAGVLD